MSDSSAFITYNIYSAEFILSNENSVMFLYLTAIYGL